nr:immunoglobulin heavy chain junction region [Homo sapiens]
ADTAVYYCARG